MSNHKIKLTLALAAALLSGHSLAQEEDKKSPTTHSSADLPDGYAVLDRYVEAIGGVEANKAVTGVQMVGTFDMPAMGITGNLTINMQAPNKRVMVIDVTGFGAIHQGTDGTVAWTTMQPGTPPTMLEGEELQEQIEDADFYSRINPRETYTSAENVGVFTHGDVKVYKVKLVDKGGTHSEALYEVESGLLRKQSFKETPESVAFATETEFNDYRPLNDKIRMPYELAVSSPQFEQTITFTAITLDPDFAEGTFDAPGAL